MVMVRVLTHAPRRHSQQETGKKFWSTKDAGQTTFSFKVRHTSALHGPPSRGAGVP